MSDPTHLIEIFLYNKFPFKSDQDLDKTNDDKYIIKDIKDGQIFRFSDPDDQEPNKEQANNLNGNLTIKAIYTPGHATDHMSFLLTSPPSTYLFAGDLILGTSTTYVADLASYMSSLYTLRDDHHFDYICLAHAVKPEIVLVDGPKKLG